MSEYDHRIQGARHFVRVLEKGLQRFTAEVERAGDLLDRTGGRIARRRLLNEAAFVVSILRPLENALNDFGGGDVEPSDVMRNEVDRLHALKAPATERKAARKGERSRKATPAVFQTRTGQSLRVIVNDAPIPASSAPATGGDHAA